MSALTSESPISACVSSLAEFMTSSQLFFPATNNREYDESTSADTRRDCWRFFRRATAAR